MACENMMKSEECSMNNVQMPNMTLENIAKACEGEYVGDETLATCTIAGAVTDSRQIEKDYLFIAIKGEKVDGHEFIPAVFEKGALAVLCENELTDSAGPYIRVKSTKEAMKKLAAFYRRGLNLKVVGITGSVGKTSTKEMIASVLSEKYNVLKTAGNFNNEIGVPITIFRIRSEHEVAVLEMGISDYGEMDRLSTMVYPDICVITNIGYCHLENLGTRDGVLQAKTECFSHMKEGGIAILNGDDDKLCTKTKVNGSKTVFYGMGENENYSVYATNVRNLGFDGVRAQIHTPQGEFLAKIMIPGEHNIYNALAATAVGLRLGLTLEQIEQGIAKTKAIAGRTNFINIGGMTVIDDCYNANPISMKTSIQVLSHAEGRSIAVLGDMGELGEDEHKLHREVGICVGQQNIHTLFCTGELAQEYATTARQTNPNVKIFYFSTREEMTKELLNYVREGDTILVKASHFMEFSKVVEALSEKDV